jgi:site-specific recombinase XerD
MPTRPDIQALLNRFEQDLILRQFRPATRRNYLLFARLYLQSLTQPIDQIHEAEIKAYLVDQIHQKGRSHESYRQLYAAIKILFSVTLGRPEDVARVPFPRRSHRPLPSVLSPQEVQDLLNALTSPKYRALFMTCYAAGLRIGEACRLQVTDIDSKQNVIRVRDGKGGRERVTLLSPKLLQELRQYWLIDRPRPWLFPGKDPNRPMTTDSARKVLAQAAMEAGLTRPCTPHTLRHCFATHLLHAGVEVVVLKSLLGHHSTRVTERYTHVTTSFVGTITSPLDLLPRLSVTGSPSKVEG